MEFRTRLESNLASESEAYGYTLCIWGAGALLIHTFGVPGFERVLAYIAGALAGFGALAALTFRGIAEPASVSESPSSLVASMIHIVSTGGTICIVQAFLAVNGTANPALAFFVVGALATVAYNLLLLLEELTTALAL